MSYGKLRDSYGKLHHVSGANTLMQITGGRAITHQPRLNIAASFRRSRNCISTCKQAQAMAIITQSERSKNGETKLVSKDMIIIMSNPHVIIRPRRSLSSRGISHERLIMKYSPISTAKYQSDARLIGASTKLK